MLFNTQFYQTGENKQLTTSLTVGYIWLQRTTKFRNSGVGVKNRRSNSAPVKAWMDIKRKH